MTRGLRVLPGSENNRAKIGGYTELLGNPAVRREKPYTIIGFPGGDVEISRCEDGTYWVHVAVRRDEITGENATVIGARIDAHGRYSDEANAALRDELARGGVNHIAFRIQPHNVTSED